MSRADDAVLVQRARATRDDEDATKTNALGRRGARGAGARVEGANGTRARRQRRGSLWSRVDAARALDRVSFALMACALWAMARFAFGRVMAPNGDTVGVPGGAVWSVLIVWACAHLGGAGANVLGVPSLIGMLLMGLLLRNVPGELVDDLPERWSSDIRAAGLSVILMRSGLELDLDAFKSVGWMAARLTLMPGLCEALTCGLFSMLIFKMSFPLGMCLGFILAAVSPAVVVLGMFELQSRGYGVTKGIPSLVVAAASFDDVVAITGYTISSHSPSVDTETWLGPCCTVRWTF